MPTHYRESADCAYATKDDDITISVEPTAVLDDVSNWLTPNCSPGGHLIGYPAITDVSKQYCTVIFNQGKEVYTNLLNGLSYRQRKPEHAFSLLLYIAVVNNVDINHLKRYLSNAEHPEIIKRLTEEDIINSYVSEVQEIINRPRKGRLNFSIAVIKELIENNFARRKDMMNFLVHEGYPVVHRISKMIYKLIYNVKENGNNKWRHRCKVITDAETISKFTNLPTNNSPLSDFIHGCWRMRPSTISGNICKTVPPEVARVVETVGEKEIGMVKCLKSAIMSHMRHFKNYVDNLPQRRCYTYKTEQWSDALSVFGKTINVYIRKYNSLTDAVDHFALVTSFVARDLSPEMFNLKSRHALGYYYGPQGYCYSYSCKWAADAIKFAKLGYYKGDFPKRLMQLDDERHRETINIRTGKQNGILLRNEVNGLNGVLEVTDDDMEFFKFLQQYYLTGAFLDINLR